MKTGNCLEYINLQYIIIIGNTGYNNILQVNVLQTVPGFPENLKPMIFDQTFNIFDTYE